MAIKLIQENTRGLGLALGTIMGLGVLGVAAYPQHSTLSSQNSLDIEGGEFKGSRERLEELFFNSASYQPKVHKPDIYSPKIIQVNPRVINALDPYGVWSHMPGKVRCLTAEEAVRIHEYGPQFKLPKKVVEAQAKKVREKYDRLKIDLEKVVWLGNGCTYAPRKPLENFAREYNLPLEEVVNSPILPILGADGKPLHLWGQELRNLKDSDEAYDSVWDQQYCAALEPLAIQLTLMNRVYFIEYGHDFPFRTCGRQDLFQMAIQLRSSEVRAPSTRSEHNDYLAVDVEVPFARQVQPFMFAIEMNGYCGSKKAQLRDHDQAHYGYGPLPPLNEKEAMQRVGGKKWKAGVDQCMADHQKMRTDGKSWKGLDFEPYLNLLDPSLSVKSLQIEELITLNELMIVNHEDVE